MKPAASSVFSGNSLSSVASSRTYKTLPLYTQSCCGSLVTALGFSHRQPRFNSCWFLYESFAVYVTKTSAAFQRKMHLQMHVKAPTRRKCVVLNGIVFTGKLRLIATVSNALVMLYSGTCCYSKLDLCLITATNHLFSLSSVLWCYWHLSLAVPEVHMCLHFCPHLLFLFTVQLSNKYMKMYLKLLSFSSAPMQSDI